MEKVVVEFKYNGTDTIIQCKENEKMGDICKRFVTKAQEDKNNLYFVYASNNLKEELTFSQCANKDDIQRKKMTILVNSLNSNNSKKVLVRSKEVICPKCHESALINIKNYKLIIFNYKNKNKNVISLNDYENTQYIDESLIICSICKENNKSNKYKNIFYRCNSCKIYVLYVKLHMKKLIII